VTVVNQVADPATKKFLVEVSADNPDLALRPNTFGDISLEVSSHTDALVVPQMAVLENSYVFVIQDDKALRREVKIGLQNTSFLEILDGLSEGDTVIVEGNYGLEDGAPIEVQEVQQ
jgi:multidrug efflux pump subunit AcrA (membrane-fusion protein)